MITMPKRSAVKTRALASTSAEDKRRTATASAPPIANASASSAAPSLERWDDIVRTYADSVYRLAYRLSGNVQDAEDLTQETFIRVFRSLDRYRPGTFEGWLHRITTNLFLDQVRHRSVVRMEALPEDTERVGSNSAGPAALMDDKLLHPDLQRALDTLSPDYRVAVVLCDIEGLRYEEIADLLGVKIGTVRSRIHRGRAQLRAQLGNVRPVLG
ncbi:RNA polymerase sigma factor SigE [Lawsonella clevelandensis]|uniref:RNA polymerase sigma factor SigE n=1 Tax=Lawsonella clevelandensis TaxID=1528099 RepID=UPI002910FBF8|nr:RNA polymerase sigma factor SigE [Lawsonella clevelandensis]MDU7193524.1 RNA polymerase sigma factor SigE [Lawsonella clevelandensis]